MATILVIDDDPVSRRVVAYTLKRLGHTLVDAADGEEAVEWLAGSTADLIILDLSLPGMDGIETLRQIRAEPVHAHLPVIMLTASGLERDERRAEEEGINEFLTKPFSSQVLIDRVVSLLG